MKQHRIMGHAAPRARPTVAALTLLSCGLSLPFALLALWQLF